MSKKAVLKPRPFTVFTDSADTFGDTILVRDKRSSRRSQNTSTKCAVLQELNTGKGFTLSPKSQVMAEKENFDPVLMKLVCHSQGAANNATILTDKDPILSFVYKTPDQGPVPDNDMLIRAPREKAVVGNGRASGSSDKQPSLTPTHRILRRSSNDNMTRGSGEDDASDSSASKSRSRRQTVGDRAKYDIDDLVMLLDHMALRRLEDQTNKSGGRKLAKPDATHVDRQLELSPHMLGVPPPLSLNPKPTHYKSNTSAATDDYDQHKHVNCAVLTGL